MTEQELKEQERLEGLPNYLLGVDEYHESTVNVSRTSLVSDPATRKLFAIFSDETEVKQQFKVIPPTPENKQVIGGGDEIPWQRIISGVWFMPDTDYERVIDDEDGFPERVTASMDRDTLMTAVRNFTQSGRINEFDVSHNGVKIEGLRTMEVWIMYDKNQLSPVLLNSIEALGYTADDIPLGTAFMTVFIENREFFQEYILSGKVKGFSIEGLFALHPKQMPDLKQLQDQMDLLNLLKGINSMEDFNELKNTKTSQLFNSLGLVQDSGALQTDKGLLTIADNGTVKIDNEYANGAFVLKSKYSAVKVIIRDGQLVDYGFNTETPNVEVGPEVKEVEVIKDETKATEDKTKVDTKDTKDTKENSKDTKDSKDSKDTKENTKDTKDSKDSKDKEPKDGKDTDITIPDSVESETATNEDNTPDIETVPTDTNQEQIDKYQKQIAELQALVVQRDAQLKKELSSKPVKKGNSNKEPENKENYLTKTIGGKTVYIPTRK